MKIKVIFLYLLSIVWVVILALLLRFFYLNETGLGQTLAFLTLVFLPGILLWRLAGIQAENLALKMLYHIGLGFCYHFIFGFLALIFSLTLSQVIFFDIFGIIILLILAVFHDRQVIWIVDFRRWFREQKLADWLLNIVLIAGSLLAFLSINAQIRSFVGDTYFQMATLQKILTAANLNPNNLWSVKNSSINIIYSYPVWHIFMAIFAKLIRINVFNVYTQIILPLTVLFLLVWWGFARTFFSNRYFALIIYLAFLVYFSSGYFYSLIPIRSPDSLNRLLIFPLLLALTANFLFSKSQKIWSNIVLLSFLGIFMGLVHFTQLIEYFLILFVFVILLLIFCRQKEVIKKSGWLFLVLGGIIFLYLSIFQNEGVKQFLLGNINSFTEDIFRNKTYRDTSIFNLYAVFALPLLILLFKKDSRFIFLAAIPLSLIMITWQVFHSRLFFLKYFGEIFVTRAITDIPGFIFFGFLIMLFILGINYIFTKLNRPLLHALYCLLGIILLIPLIFFKGIFLDFIDQTFFGGKNLIFYNTFLPVFICLCIITAVILLIAYFKKKDLNLPEVNNPNHFVIIAIIVFCILSLPYYRGLYEKIITNPNGGILVNRQINYYGEIEKMGGEKTADFLKALTPEDVFAVSNTAFSQMVLLYCQCYAAEYPYGITNFTFSAQLFDPSISLEARQKILDNHSTNYVIAINPQEEKIFSDNPEMFEKIFENYYTYLRTTEAKGTYQKEGEFVVFKYHR